MLKGSLQEKNGIYQAVFYYNGKQKWKSTGIKVQRGNKRKAQQRLKEILLEYESNPHMYDKISFVDYSRKWLEKEEGAIDIITFESYKQHVEKHIIPYFEPLDLRLQQVTFEHIEKYYSYKLHNGRLDGKKGGLSRDSIKRHGVVLSLIFKDAVKRELIKQNPCEFAKIPKAQKSKNINYYTKEQCQTLLDIIKGEPLHDMVYITFLYGLRRSELVGLRWRDINFSAGTVTICHTIVANGIVVEKDKTKSQASNRVYPLLDDVREMLLNIKEKQKADKKLYGKKYINSGYVFTNEEGKPYYPDYPSKRLIKIIKRNNLPRITWHDLRHSCASALLNENWSMKDISDWLGHADISTTMNIYAHLDMTHKRKMGNSLNGLLKA
ncbi:MAG TPA: site-specific integrase [Candidatus Ornithomonoglobus intestinigallinarum]|uniref:Site-specific integrase n=1 Tax=Candidatus Ornithomonoglobus intestinigallinarum TaxID=2840894 RepID=A0A9D1H158_9FIRM|nr:site-specific integrase [Candidatus Ornithomonoglobus intestinigallinarum]